MDQIQRGAQDIVFAALPAGGEGVRNRPLPAMPMGFIGLAAQHRKRAYTLAELARGELLTFQRGSQPHVALLDALRQAGSKTSVFTPSPAFLPWRNWCRVALA